MISDEDVIEYLAVEDNIPYEEAVKRYAKATHLIELGRAEMEKDHCVCVGHFHIAHSGNVFCFHEGCWCELNREARIRLGFEEPVVMSPPLVNATWDGTRWRVAEANV